MDVRFQKMVDRWAGIPLCAALSAWHAIGRLRSRGMPAPPPRRILVILLSDSGSLVLAEPMFRRLRDRHPAAEIHAMVAKRHEPVLAMLRVVDPGHVITIRDDSWPDLVADLRAAIRAMRAARFDTVVDCEPSSRLSALLTALGGARTMVGFHRHTQEGLYRGSFLTSRVLYNPYRHLTHQFVTLADAIESTTRPSGKDGSPRDAYEPPNFTPESGELEREVAALHRDHPVTAGRPIVLLSPSGRPSPIRAWPLEHYAQVANALLTDGFVVGVLGMSDDRPLAERLRNECGNDPNVVNLTGYTRSVRHLMTLFHRASLLITNDGGPGPYAAMTPLHTIVFFGPRTPTLHRSWSPNAHAFFTSLPCAPCLTARNDHTSPCDGDNQCLKRIHPGEVLAKAREMLRKARPTGCSIAPAA